jgi:uncharacterized protein (TIGR03435 family)
VAIGFMAWRKSLLIAVTWTAMGVSLLGQKSRTSQADLPAKFREFDVASVKLSKATSNFFRMAFTQDGVRIENGSLLTIVPAAYGLFNSLDDKFLNIRGWAKTEKFNVEAKVSPADVEEYKKLTMEQRQLMMQALLADRFKLLAHRETKEQSVYLLVVTKNGSKPGEGNEAGGSMKRSRNQLEGAGVVMSQLVSALTQAASRTVVDRTGLTGRHDFTLHWTPDEEGVTPLKAADSTQPANETIAAMGPSIFTAVQEQLGLRLEPR